MAEREFYVGTTGPYFYEDTDALNPEADPNDPTYNPQDLETQDGVHTSGQLWVGHAPLKDGHVVRYIDAADVLTSHIHPFLLIGA